MIPATLFGQQILGWLDQCGGINHSIGCPIAAQSMTIASPVGHPNFSDGRGRNRGQSARASPHDPVSHFGIFLTRQTTQVGGHGETNCRADTASGGQKPSGLAKKCRLFVLAKPFGAGLPTLAIGDVSTGSKRVKMAVICLLNVFAECRELRAVFAVKRPRQKAPDEPPKRPLNPAGGTMATSANQRQPRYNCYRRQRLEVAIAGVGASCLRVFWP